ncbi:MAG: anthrax toxin lethal factor-related metalloendopeptidase [Blautia sp.]|jgi:hypothetical protein
MKIRKIKDLWKNRKFAAGCAAVVLAITVASVGFFQSRTQIPELPSYTDPVLEVTIEGEETPLAAAPKVTTKTSKKTSKKNVKLAKAATKTYTKKLPTSKKTTTKKQNTSKEAITTQTTVLTAKSEKYTRKSKVKVVTTTVTTTVKKTTVAKTSSGSDSTVQASASRTEKYQISVEEIAPLMDSRVLAAYEKLGFTVTVDPSVSYAGHFDAKTQSLTLRRADDTVYHELGHFLAFIAGNADKSSSFVTVYNQEKSKYTGVNKAYATQNSSEYFAESVRDYVLNPASLKSSRPKTYAALTEAFNKVTDNQLNKILMMYGPIWK